jgi:hypothetical protein
MGKNSKFLLRQNNMFIVEINGQILGQFETNKDAGECILKFYSTRKIFKELGGKCKRDKIEKSFARKIIFKNPFKVKKIIHYQENY